MVFKERLKEKRTEANLTQVELAEKAGVTARTIQNYELGSRKPSNMVTIQKIADALNTTTEYLLGSSGTYVVEAHEKGGAKAAKDIEELVSEVTGMFALSLIHIFTTNEPQSYVLGGRNHPLHSNS